MQSGYCLRLQNRLTELDHLAQTVEAFGETHGLSPKLVYQIGLVLDELFTNIVSYGYQDGGEHDISLHMSRERGRLRFMLLDDAAPFDPLSAKSPDLVSPVDARRIGGLGIHFVRSMMDRVAYERVGNRNTLILEKDID